MKPTQEQVIAWAREAGVYHIAPNATGSLLYMSQQSLYRGFFLAYEAGRAAENEACAKVCEDLDDGDYAGGDQPYGIHYARAIRARREQ